jgi:diguanylate cyclase
MSKIIFSIISLVVICYYFCIGFYVLSLNKKHKTNITFFLLCVIFFIFTLGCILFQSPDSEESLLALYKLGITLTVFIPALAILISLQLSNLIRLQWMHYAVIFCPTVFLAVKTIIVTPYVHFIFYENSWRLAGITNPNDFFLYFIFLLVFTCMYIAINLLWYFRTSIKREKRQAITLFCSFFIFIFAYAFIMIMLIHVFKIIKYEYAGASSLSCLIWATGFNICLVRFRLLSLTPELISRDILSAIDESIILTDIRGYIVTTNDKTKVLLGYKDMSNISLRKMILEYKQIGEEIKRLLTKEVSDFSKRLNFYNNKKEEINMRTRFSLIYDKFEDPIGILIIAREAKEFTHFVAAYNITDREAHIIQFLIEGDKNTNIAELLGITENTLKRHVTNIYNKLRIRNKVGLINLLKEFDLVPEQITEQVEPASKNRNILSLKRPAGEQWAK